MGVNENARGDSINYYTTNVKATSNQVSTGLIENEEGFLIEVTVPEYKAGEVSRGRAQRTLSNFSKIEGILYAVARPVVSAAKKISMAENVSINAEVEIGLSFESEGNIYFTKHKSEANLVVKLTIKQNKDLA